MILVFRDDFRIELQRVGNFNGICSMGTQKQFRIIKIVKIIDRISGTKFDSFDFLQIDKKQIEKKVQQEAHESAEKLMREQINGYSSVSVKNADFRALKEKWSYTLLPVWTITYKAKNEKIYYFSMNGQTGKVYGELPIDYKKISLVSGIVSLVSLVILLLGGLA
jgi:hypothetical protein